MPELVLGTANFSGDYGRKIGKNFKAKNAREIIRTAQLKGINHFDTAKSYLGAEKILGQELDNIKTVEIDSKISASDCISVESIINSVKVSLTQLKVPGLSTLYLHSPTLLLEGKANFIETALDYVIDFGLAKNLGVSVYDYEDIIKCKLKYSRLTRFQINENICDQRLLNCEVLNDLSNEGNKFFIRSIFLQGLLLMNPNNLSGEFKKAKNQIQQLNTFAQNNNTTVIDLCLAYVKSIPWATGIVFGVDTASQLEEVLESDFRLPSDWKRYISTIPTNILDPRNW